MKEDLDYSNIRVFSKETNILSRELFFHVFDDNNQKQILQMSHTPLFNLKGRATIDRGTVHSDGMYACYRIPKNFQKKVLTPPFDAGYESWVHGSKTMLALRQSVPPELKEEVYRWLEAVRYRAPYRYNNDIPYDDVVFLPSDYFVAGFKVDSSDLDFWEKGKGFSRKVHKITLTNPINVLDAPTLLEAMQCYYEGI